MPGSESGTYIPRVVDDELDWMLAGLPAICINGPRAVGKTRTALRRARTVHNLDDPQTMALTRADPSRLTIGEQPVLIDEWQRYPYSWDLVRRAVDENPAPGRFLLTGSTGPATPPTHSGAGRIVTLRMRPMSLSERGLETPTVSLGRFLAGGRPRISGRTEVGLSDYTRAIVQGGFPGIQTTNGKLRSVWFDGYLDRAVDHEVGLMGRRVRRPSTMRRWMGAYAAATSTTASYEAILDASTPAEGDKPAKTTTAAYRDLLEVMWLVEPVPSWQPGVRSLKRLKRGPKHHLADPALAARLLDVSEEGLMSTNPSVGSVSFFHTGPLLGALFESLVTQSVRVYAQAHQARVGHLRTWNDLREVGLIVEQEGKVLGIEVKLTAVPTRSDTANLRWLGQQLGPGLTDAMIITTGRHAYRDQDGIAVIPAALLGP